MSFESFIQKSILGIDFEEIDKGDEDFKLKFPTGEINFRNHLSIDGLYVVSIDTPEAKKLEISGDNPHLLGDWIEISICIGGEIEMEVQLDGRFQSFKMVEGQWGFFTPDRNLEKYVCRYSDAKLLNIFVENSFIETLGQFANKPYLKNCWNRYSGQLFNKSTLFFTKCDKKVRENACSIHSRKSSDITDLINMRLMVFEILKNFFEINMCKTLDQVYSSVINIVEESENYYSLEDISRISDISKYRINEAFFEATGESYFKYMQRLKANKACRLLEKNLPVIEVAEQMGFENPSKFSAMFKKVRGMTPTEYRKREIFGGM
ncbi:MAG: AraC family transcriptional regulator [Tissierellia bacterium]|nr:AraC family transcriptional regulator [Tissierellia bacterium]